MNRHRRPRGAGDSPVGAYLDMRWAKSIVALLILSGAVYAGGAFTGIRPAGDAIADAAQFTAWEVALEMQQALIADNRAAIDAATAVLWQRVVDVQTRLVEIDASTTALVAALGADPEALAQDAAAAATVDASTVPSTAPMAAATAADLATLLDDAGAELAARERQLGVLEALLQRYRAEPRGRPVAAGRISSHYGERTDPFTGDTAHHNGVDIAGTAGTAVVAVADGLVTWSGPRAGYGQTVDLTHGHDLVTRYAHNAENLVEVGDVVRRGEIIARLGASGRATGPNLHFEVLHERRSVDPLVFME